MSVTHRLRNLSVWNGRSGSGGSSGGNPGDGGGGDDSGNGNDDDPESSRRQPWERSPVDSSSQWWKQYIPDAELDARLFYECLVEVAPQHHMVETEIGALLTLLHRDAHIVTKIIPTFFSPAHDTAHNVSTSTQQRVDTTSKAIEAVQRDGKVKTIVQEFARLIAMSGNSKIPVQALEAFLKGLSMSQAFLTQNVGNAVEIVKGLGSHLYSQGQQPFLSTTPRHSRPVPETRRREYISMEDADPNGPFQLPSEILSRTEVPGVTDSESSGMRVVQVLEEACHMWVRKQNANFQVVCLADKQAVLALCPPSVRQIVRNYERSQKILLAVVNMVLQEVVKLAGSEFELSHMARVLGEANQFPTHMLMNKGFPVHMVEAENLFFRVPNNALGVFWMFLSTGTPIDGRHLTAVASAQAQMLARVERNWKSMVNIAQMMVRLGQMGGAGDDEHSRLQMKLHVIVANLEALHLMSALPHRHYKRLTSCQRALRALRLPNLHHPAATGLRHESQLLLGQLESVVSELSRVSSLDDLASMLQSYFNLESVADPLAVIVSVFVMLHERMHLVHGAVETAIREAHWKVNREELPVTEDTLTAWRNEDNSGSDLVSPTSFAEGKKTVDRTDEHLVKRVVQWGVGMNLQPEEKIVLGASSGRGELSKEDKVVELLTGQEHSDLYSCLRPKLRYGLVKEVGERRGWGTPLANGQFEAASRCPLTLEEALKTLDVEELAAFFNLFPDKLLAWRRKVYDAHTKLIEEYRAKVRQFHEDKRAQKKGGVTAAFVDWVAGVADEDEKDEVQCRSLNGDPERAALVEDLTEVRQQVVALTARLEQAGLCDGGPAPQLSSMPPRLSERQKLSLRRLLANDVGDGVTEDDIVDLATELGVADLLE